MLLISAGKGTFADKSLPCLQFTNSVREYFSAHGLQVNGKHYTEYAKLWVRLASTCISEAHSESFNKY